ncbi:DNA-dependent RNA polymerase subunit epsilon [Alkalihalobacillus sp. AL-G]|uniref:DNA-dependent RNA polymerase subunit epsilon n=1 Tax=Alkalihalobacillus sp. AL-G TaxID=2926399 RepID=UPI00272D17DA|nr:DNA-directed RNA polymerase subunit epsilon [Alkalihalobacillus sp. AL-G]WLD94993.1 DNA-directed RNA polymerase subunit epsilon [Alkalihalobacillus sp. AL-G]
MIFKVFYQESLQEVPVREETKSLYFEADSVQAVRSALAGRNYNIEFIQQISGSHLKYEQQFEDFELETR